MSPFSNLEVFESHLGNLPFDIHHVLKVLCSFNSSFILVITYMSTVIQTFNFHLLENFNPRHGIFWGYFCLFSIIPVALTPEYPPW